MRALAKSLGAFNGSYARIIWRGPNGDHLFLAGITPWDDPNGRMPAFVLKMQHENVLEQYYGMPYAAGPPLSFEVFELTTVSGNRRTLYVGRGDSGYSIAMRLGSVAELLRLSVDSKLYERFYKGGDNVELGVFKKLVRDFCYSERDAREPYPVKDEEDPRRRIWIPGSSDAL